MRIVDAGATTPSLSERTLSGQITLRPAFDRTAQSPEELGPDRQYLGSLGYKPPIKRGMRPRRQRQSRQRSWNETFNMRSDQKTLISIRDKDFLYRYYEKVFKNLQQTNCRILSKAYVKLVEPRKHVNYPYNGRKIVSGRTLQLKPDETKPPWWPSGVIHREPDHLLKPGKGGHHFRFKSGCLLTI